MAYCDSLNTTLAAFCGPNPGGVVAAYIADFDKVYSVTIGSTSSIVTAISMTQSGLYYKFNFREDTSSLTQTNTPTKSGDMVEQVGSLVFQNLSTLKRNTFNLLRGKKLSIIYKDNNSQYWLSGYTIGVRSTSIVQATGADRGDDNIWTVVMTAKEPEFCYEVQSSVMTPYL